MEEKYLKDYNGKTWQRDQIPAETGIHTIVQPVWGEIFDDDGHLVVRQQIGYTNQILVSRKFRAEETLARPNENGVTAF